MTFYVYFFKYVSKIVFIMLNNFFSTKIEIHATKPKTLKKCNDKKKKQQNMLQFVNLYLIRIYSAYFLNEYENAYLLLSPDN